MAEKGSKGLSKEELAAMRERVKELKDAARRKATRDEGEKAVRAKLASFSGTDRVLGEKVHAIIRSVAPELVPRLWYGMPAYSKDEEIVCFFRDAKKFGTRYATLGFSDEAKLDDGNVWPTDFALTSINASDEARIRALVKRAVGEGA